MSDRLDFLAAELKRFLIRYQPAKDWSLLDPFLREQAKSDEIAALLRALDRACPTVGYQDWWGQFSDVLAETLRTRAWPSVGDVAKAAERMPKPKVISFPRGSSGGNVDPHEESRQRRLRAWWSGNGSIGQNEVTAARCMAIGLSIAETEAAIAFAKDPFNWGVDKHVTLDDRRRQQERHKGAGAA